MTTIETDQTIVQLVELRLLRYFVAVAEELQCSRRCSR
jgi:hypothetical protein